MLFYFSLTGHFQYPYKAPNLPIKNTSNRVSLTWVQNIMTLNLPISEITFDKSEETFQIENNLVLNHEQMP